MMMGLRLTLEGVSASQFQRRFGQSLADRLAGQIDRLRRFGLLEWASTPVRPFCVSPPKVTCSATRFSWNLYDPSRA